MLTKDKKCAMLKFTDHLRTAKTASALAGGMETTVDHMLDDLARCLDTLHGTDEFSKMAENN